MVERARSRRSSSAKRESVVDEWDTSPHCGPAACDDENMKLTGESPSPIETCTDRVAEVNCVVTRRGGKHAEANNPAQNSLSVHFTRAIGEGRRRQASLEKAASGFKFVRGIDTIVFISWFRYNALNGHLTGVSAMDTTQSFDIEHIDPDMALAAISQGNTVAITAQGQPVADIVPRDTAPAASSLRDSVEALLAFRDAHPVSDLAAIIADAKVH
jgi:hypothetical protein